MMPARLAWQALACTALICAQLATAEQLPPRSAVGHAYDRTTGQFLYSEYHSCENGLMQCTVTYRDSNGAIFARKHLDYRQNLIAPSLVMTDYRRDVEVRVPASKQANLVVDAGFDNYVRSIWDDLDAGDNTKFAFQVAGFDKPIKMQALRSAAIDCSADELCLEINLDSWFLRMLIDPIELSYSRADRRLLRFSGISNIKGDNGESLNVDIHYRYQAELLLAGPLERQPWMALDQDIRERSRQGLKPLSEAAQ